MRRLSGGTRRRQVPLNRVNLLLIIGRRKVAVDFDKGPFIVIGRQDHG